MANEYRYQLADCDVLDRGALERYRAKRDGWMRELSGDPEHSVYRQITSMLWNDRVFRTVNDARRLAHERGGRSSALNSPIARFIDQGYVATQALAIRRLTETNTSKKPDRQVISLRMLVEDIAAHRGMITREMYVCHDGLPFDYGPARERFYRDIAAKEAGWSGFLPTHGPEAYDTSVMAHAEFDRLSGVSPDARARADLIHPSVFDRLRAHIDGSGHAAFKTFADKYIAHAGDERSRLLADEAKKTFTFDRLAACQRAICEVADFIYGPILYYGAHGLLPTPQFNQFEGLDQPWCDPQDLDALDAFWDRHTEQVEAWGKNVFETIMGSGIAPPRP
jgi:hypothetical protein